MEKKDRLKKDRLIKLATELFGKIEPVNTKGTLEECFTEDGDTVFFWFNTPDKSTHLLSE